MGADDVTVIYEFRLGTGQTKQFTLRLKKPDLELAPAAKKDPPSWTRLTHHQCPNCPLNAKSHPRCPVAVQLVDAVEFFKDHVSTEETDITVRVESREYHKCAPVQQGVSSLMGLYMVTGGCPVMNKLRPLVHTHLPFATVKETMFRAVSMHLLAQYFLQKRGQTPDWQLKNLVRTYEEIRQVNRAFVQRLLSIKPRDASLNALVGLDCFATATAFSISEDSLREIEPLFHAYLQETGKNEPTIPPAVPRQ
jgi:hypothetical protein